MTTLEKAARAACASDGEDWDEIHETPAEGIPCRSNYLAMTSAALSSALLDPSDDIVRVAADAFTQSEGWEDGARAALHAAGVKITGKD